MIKTGQIIFRFIGLDIAYNLPIEGLIDETGTVPSKIFKNVIVLIVNNRISLKEMVSTILCWY